MKTFISCLLVLMAIQVKAESIQWGPEQVRQVLTEAEQEGQIENLKLLFTPQVMENIESYSQLPDDVTKEDSTVAVAPVLAGAFAAGAAAAVAEKVWDAIVGNGGPQKHEIYAANEFDLEKPVKASSLTPSKVLPTPVVTSHQMYLPVGGSAPIKMNSMNPQAVTPAAVGMAVAEATAAAVGYKAAQYLMNKYGAVLNEDIIKYNAEYFDLNGAY